MKKTSQNQDRHERQIIDYLEDPDFRNWILHPGRMTPDHISKWQGLVANSENARQARYILQSLKLYFEQNHLTEQEIEERLNREIEKYRTTGNIFQYRRRSVVRIWRVAAAIALMVGMFFLIQWLNRPLEVYKTGFGEQMTIELLDASVIQLNSNSTLTWDRSWEKSNERKVELDGEAYFSVEHIDGMPFRVSTDDITVNVTGTQFNVNSRRQRTMVYLEEGKVDVAVKEKPETKYKMEPGDELVYNVSEKKVVQKKIDAPEEISGWKEGLLVFRQEPLMKVLESVSDIYGKEFVTKDSALLNRNITTTIPLTNWQVSLTAIQLAMRLEVEEQNDTVRIKERK